MADALSKAPRVVTKPLAKGGLDLGTIQASLILAAFVVVCLAFTRRQMEPRAVA